MEIGKYAQDLLQRIQKIEPENGTKLFGYLLLQHSLEEVMEYAVGNEEQIHSLIAEAKSYLMLSPKLNFSDHLHPYYSHAFTLPFSPPSSIRVPPPIHLAANQQSPSQNLDHFHHNDVRVMEEQVHPPRSRSQPRCHYFYKGYCMLGQSCKFFHDHANPDSFNKMFGIGLKEFPIEDYVFSPGSLEKLEMEIIELLKARRGFPVSLASLPLLYQEMYGKSLQAEGYLTGSQRHGEVGFSLTKLLARLSNIILVDRPHGQHSVVLAEDAPKNMELMNERNDPGNSSSHQIYLTFPAESTFTDIDVQNYFNQFGPVHDVRIPHQEKRMFGFVSFYHPQTVRRILEMGHPHNICGSRVLVKPYIEKSRLVQRKNAEKLNAEMCLSSISFDMDSGLSTTLHSSLGRGAYETSQFYGKQQIEDCETALALNRKQLLELKLCPRPLAARPYHRYELEESKVLEDRFSSLSIASHKNTDYDDKIWQPCSNCNDQDSLNIQLPESPFTSPRSRSDNLYSVL